VIASSPLHCKHGIAIDSIRISVSGWFKGRF
jgi:hypothetical protein